VHPSDLQESIRAFSRERREKFVYLLQFFYFWQHGAGHTGTDHLTGQVDVALKLYA